MGALLRFYFLCKKISSMLLLLLNRCKLSYFISYRCLNLTWSWWGLQSLQRWSLLWIICSQTNHGFSTMAYLPTILLINQSSSLTFLTPYEDLTLDTNRQSCCRHHGVSLIGKPMTTQHHQTSHLIDALKEASLAKEWNSSLKPFFQEGETRWHPPWAFS